MKKTLYEIILEKLGVEDGEKFNIIKQDGESSEYNPCHFEDGFLIDKEDDFNENDFFDLLLGKATIEKLPWKPKKGDMVWYIGNDNGIAYDMPFRIAPDFLSMLKCEWLFKTKEEAEANKERVLKEMKEVLSND